ncbi:MAG: hypothetical protein H7256_06225 [Bdellovibrio sp.]|nr:hypothetical protein [Bdellovibrio sp.]
MSWNKKLILILVLSVSSLASLPAFANEHGEAKPAAAEGGHGGAASAAGELKYSGRQTDEWLKVQADLTALKGKVETQKGLVEGLIMAKAHGGGHTTSEESETLKKEHENLLRMIEQYNALTTSFQNRFPEKGAAIGRVYKRIDSDSVETIEATMTAEGRMRQLNKKIKNQYEKVSEKKKPESAHGSVKTEAASEKLGKKVHIIESTKSKKKITEEIPVTDQIILQK